MVLAKINDQSFSRQNIENTLFLMLKGVRSTDHFSRKINNRPDPKINCQTIPVLSSLPIDLDLFLKSDVSEWHIEHMGWYESTINC